MAGTIYDGEADDAGDGSASPFPDVERDEEEYNFSDIEEEVEEYNFSDIESDNNKSNTIIVDTGEVKTEPIEYMKLDKSQPEFQSFESWAGTSKTVPAKDPLKMPKLVTTGYKIDITAEKEAIRAASRHQKRLADKYPMLAGVAVYLLEEIERLQDEYTAYNDAWQEVDRSAMKYLRIGGVGQWLELTRLKVKKRPKGRVEAHEEFIIIPLSKHQHYTEWQPIETYGGPRYREIMEQPEIVDPEPAPPIEPKKKKGTGKRKGKKRPEPETQDNTSLSPPIKSESPDESGSTASDEESKSSLSDLKQEDYIEGDVEMYDEGHDQGYDEGYDEGYGEEYDEENDEENDEEDDGEDDEEYEGYEDASYPYAT